MRVRARKGMPLTVCNEIPTALDLDVMVPGPYTREQTQRELMFQQ
jgi:hypothetical protein